MTQFCYVNRHFHFWAANIQFINGIYLRSSSSLADTIKTLDFIDVLDEVLDDPLVPLVLLLLDVLSSVEAVIAAAVVVVID